MIVFKLANAERVENLPAKIERVITMGESRCP
jgi:hypothetical protein